MSQVLPLSEPVQERFVADHEPDNSPIVFIIGFANSPARHYNPLKEHYETLTNHVVVHVPVMFAHSLDHTDDDGQNFLDNVFYPVVNARPYSPIMFHIFSQNGSLMFYRTYPKMPLEHKQRIVGCVFDCCPAAYAYHIRYLLNAKHFFQKKKDQTLYNYYFKIVPTNMMFALRHSYKVITGAKEQFADGLSRLDLPHNILFLCSKDDELVKYANLEEFILSQVRKGKNVEMRAWDHAEHCAMFREPDKKEEYKVLCKNFFERLFTQRLRAKL